MTGPDAFPTARRRALATAVLVIAATNTFQLGTGVLGALVPFRIAQDSAEATLAGFVTSAYAVGFLMGCLAAPETIRLLGARRVLAGGSVVAATMALALAVVPAGAAWALLRVVSGLAGGHVMTIMEAWIADRAPPGRSGLVFSAYMVLSRVVFGLGQLSLALGDLHGLGHLSLAAFGYLLAPFVSSRVTEPPPPIGTRNLAGLLELPRHAPVVAVGAFVHAAIVVTALNLLPVWGLAHALPVERIAAMLVAIQAAAIVFQILVGPLSDLLDRRLVMGAACTAGALLSLAGPQAAGLAPLPAVLLVGAWAGSSFVLYALLAAYMTDIARPDQRMVWSSSLLIMWGLGSVVGPMVGALVMDHVGADALFGFIGVLNAAFAGYLLLHRRKR